MSTSFVEYQGYGFWSWDGYLEHVLALLADAIGSSTSQEWLRELRDHWRLHSSGVFLGFIHPGLDEFLTNDERRDTVLGLVREISESAGLTREARETAGFLESLLLGKLKTDASSPLDYMVRGDFPYQWSGSKESLEPSE